MRTRLAGSVALLTIAATAHAGGLGRPNIISARAFGYGGAFTAIADDPSALHFNPAGMALQDEDGFLVGGEIIVAPRSYTPIDAMGVKGPAQKPHNTPNPLPVLGYVTRLPQNGQPSRLALGIGFWNTFGGALTYDKGDPMVPALDATTTAVLEIVPGVAYKVNDFLSLGFAFRLGLGIFAVDATAKPANGSFSSFGVGAGATFGAMISPPSLGGKLQIGLAYRTSLTTNTSGSGNLELTAGTQTPVEMSHRQEWPQQASLGVSYRVSRKLRVAAQADWTDWSKIDKIIIQFKNRSNLDQIYNVDFKDNFALHAGGQFMATDKLALRAGYTFDSNAVPDRTIERQYLDGNKNAIDVGVGVQVNRHWRIDSAFEYIFGGVRHIANNTAEWTMAGWPSRANVAPGDHEGTVYTLELNLQYRY